MGKKSSGSELVWVDSAAKAGLDGEKIAMTYRSLERSIELGKTPGAVCVVGIGGKALEPRAFGYAQVVPRKQRMQPTTIFDLASVTKMVATNTAVMLLVERGKIRLSDSVAHYLPEFGTKGKEQITVKHLLTHTSGLIAWRKFYATLKGKEAYYRAICDEELVSQPGEKRVYSDLGFMTLGFLVERVSGEGLDVFTRENIFRPLGMNETMFNPPKRLRGRCAATEIVEWRHELMKGEVHDENANAMGGIAGHAGLFSTAHDLAIFCQMLLNGGSYGGVRILSPETIEQFHTLQLDPQISKRQALGWLLGDELWSGLGEGSFGHTGFTGTSLWIQPKQRAFAILLTNAIHPQRENAERAYFQKRFYHYVMEAAKMPKRAIFSLLDVDEQWVDRTLAKMTLEQKAGQMLFVTYNNKRETALELLKEVEPGGIIVFPGNDAQRTARLIRELQEQSKEPLLVTADFERGVGNYIDGATDLVGNMALGASRSDEDAYLSGVVTAIEGRAMGVHVVFAPVVDVNNNPRNPIINIRSFGEDPELVGRLAVAWIHGAQENGMLATVKHFPGHGNTETDSHGDLARIPGSLKDIRRIELHPFKRAIEDGGVSGVMSAHIWLPAIEKQPTPATVSRRIMTDILRKELGFTGIVYTDAMVMGGVAKRLSYEDSIVGAVQAGCDAILMPGDAARARKAIVQAVREGRLKESAVDDAVRRILGAKSRVGLAKEPRTADPALIEKFIGTEEHYAIAREIAQNCITIVIDKKKLLPLKEKQKIAIIGFANQIGKRMIWRDTYTFGDEMKKRSKQVEYVFLGDQITTSGRSEALRIAGESDVVVLAAYPRIVIQRGNTSLNPEQVTLVNEVRSLGKPIVLISFGSPYVINELSEKIPSAPAITTYVCTYGNAAAVQDATADAILGKFHPAGKLPITINKDLRAGAGI